MGFEFILINSLPSTKNVPQAMAGTYIGKSHAENGFKSDFQYLNDLTFL